MTSAVLYNAINPSIAVSSRSHFPFLICRSLTQKPLSRTQEFGNFKKHIRAKAGVGEAPKTQASEFCGNSKTPEERNLRILVAGGGIGGLVFALAAKRKGFEVMVFERDLSAIRGEGQYRGPIQIQSNALAALEAVDMDVADEIMNAGCITGDRINGLVDGISGTW